MLGVMDKTLKWLETLYLTLVVVIFGGIVLHAPLSVGLGVLLPDYALIIKSWKELLMVLLIPVALIVVTRRKLWGVLARDWLFHGIIAFALIHVVTVIMLYQGAAPTAAGLAIDLRYTLFFALVYVLVKARPEYKKPLLVTAGIGAAVVILFGALQLFLPPDILKYIGYSKETIAPYLTVDQNENFVRINSTLRGPNPLGAYVIMAMAAMASILLVHKLWIKKTWRAWVFLFMGVASVAVLYSSHSRSAWLGAVAALGVVVATVAWKAWPRKVWIALGVAGLILVGGLVALRDVPFVSTVLLHEDPNEGGAVNSNDGHLSSLIEGSEKLIEQPLGAGVGSTGSASILTDQTLIIENQYLFIAHEVGWVGLALFVMIFGIIMWRLWQRRTDWLALTVFASGVGLALVGVLLPVWVDDTVSIVWWGLAAMALIKEER